MAKDALKEAIAEAKTLRETAIANAKLALEEAFTPKIQSMLSAKLNEMDDLEEDEDLEEYGGNIDPGAEPKGQLKRKPDVAQLEEETYEESTISEEELDEILSELDLEEGHTEDHMEEGHTEDHLEEELEEEINIDEVLAEAEEEEEVEEEESDEEESEAPEGDDEDDEELDLESMTVSDLKDLIADIVADITGDDVEDEIVDGHVEVEDEDEDDEVEIEMGDEEEVTLEELLSELEDMEEGEEKVYEKKDEMYEEKDDEIMEEVESLKQELNEVNLLNSKLLYVSKLFKENNLSENQKLKIVDTFDKATTAKEAKLVFETLNESISTKTIKAKHSINESLSFASKSAGVAAPKPIVDIDPTVSRFQKLAGLN